MGYTPHFLLGPPRRIGESRVPDPRTAHRRLDEIELAIHALATEYREPPAPVAKDFVAAILGPNVESVPSGSVRRVEQCAQAVIGGWRVLSYGIEDRITDQSVAWFAWLVPVLAPPHGWLTYWTIAWAAHCRFTGEAAPLVFPGNDPDLMHDAFVRRREQVLATETFGFAQALRPR